LSQDSTRLSTNRCTMTTAYMRMKLTSRCSRGTGDRMMPSTL
jgi:hypothetical protein